MQWYSSLLKVIATLGPVGYCVGGGTWASVFTYLLLYRLHALYALYWPFALPLIILFSLGVIWFVGPFFKKKDPSEIVLDEVIGSCIACIGLLSWEGYVLSLVLFRFFDIYKPLGIFYVQSLPGALGIIADDILAAVYAVGLCHSIAYYL